MARDSSAVGLRLTRLVRSAVRDLFDQSSPLQAAHSFTASLDGHDIGDLSLAGTLSYHLSEAAKGRSSSCY